MNKLSKTFFIYAFTNRVGLDKVNIDDFERYEVPGIIRFTWDDDRNCPRILWSRDNKVTSRFWSFYREVKSWFKDPENK